MSVASLVGVAPPLLPCPLHELTGLWCPGCGLTRASLALLRGDPLAAFGHNVLWPVFLGAIVLGPVVWWRASRGRPAPRWLTEARTGIVAAAVLLVFGVLRNLSPFGALAP